MKTYFRFARILLPALSVLCLCALPPSCKRTPGTEAVAEASAPKKDTVYPLGFCTDSFALITGSLARGETFSTLMSRLGMDPVDAMTLTGTLDSTFNVRRMKAGDNWKAYYRADSIAFGALEYLVYETDRVNMTVFHCREPLSAWNVSKPVEMEHKWADVTITSSLWEALVSAGVYPALVSRLAEIYAWSIDFSAVSKGDRFRVIYDQETCEGEVVDIHHIYFVLFQHNGKEYPAIYFDPGEGRNTWWKPDGESLRKAFLKAPLKFTYVSSGFSYRINPVTWTAEHHPAVDYAAPYGTPIVAVGDGTITMRGWGGGGGNMIIIKHNNRYTTSYMHMSRFAPGQAVGSHVSQGDVIGYVGSTGLSTGPHLDFRVIENGRYIDPLSLNSPAAEPLPDEKKPIVDSLYHLYMDQLDSLCVASADTVHLEKTDIH